MGRQEKLETLYHQLMLYHRLWKSDRGEEAHLEFDELMAMCENALEQRVYDKHGQLVETHRSGTIRGHTYIKPYRLDLQGLSKFSYPEIWRHEGGRVEFEAVDRWATEWREVRRSYESWYYNPHTGETWGREEVDPEKWKHAILDWSTR